MNTHNQQCDPHRITDYLEDRLDSDALDDLKVHLESCAECQAEMTLRAAEPEFWEETVGLLGQTKEPMPANEGTDLYAAPARRSLEVATVIDSLAPSDDPQMLGRLGEYEIRGVVGVGGMGAVLKGFDRSLLRVVAIKVMAPSLANSGSARTRFEREARAAAAITHNHVIDIYRVSEANGLPYLVMPFARGPSLQRRIDDGGPLSAIEVARIGRQIASGLAAAHEQGLVHRDIKPANILLNDGIERVLITDFGVARAIDDASMTQTGLIAGTPQYMSPEQARGESVDCRSDLFSMGAVLYTACTGRPPFRADAAYGILRRITDTEPRPIREVNPSVPDWLCNVVSRLMAKHPSDRFQTAAEVAQLMETCLAHLQQPTQIPIPDALTRQSTISPDHDSRSSETLPSFANTKPRTGIFIMITSLILLASTMLAFQITSPPEIAGQWQGETWANVELSTVDEATHWFSGKIADRDGNQGALHLEWSRIQRRYNGRWTLGEDSAGAITLRNTRDGLRGAISLDAQAVLPEGEPRLREFVWKRGQSASHVARGDKAAKRPRSSLPASRPRSAAKAPSRPEGVANDESARSKLIATLKASDTDRANAMSRLSDDSIVQRIGAMFGPVSNLSKRINSANSDIRELKIGIERARVKLAKIDQGRASTIAELETVRQKDDVKRKPVMIQSLQARLSVYDNRLAELQLVFEINKRELTEAERQLDAAEFEKKTILEMIRRERDAMQKRADQQKELLESARLQISNGDLHPNQAVQTEMDLGTTVGRLQQLELLVEYFSLLGDAQGSEKRDPFGSGLPANDPGNKKGELSAKTRLKIQAAEAKLAGAEAEYKNIRGLYERTAKLFEKSFVSKAELEADEAKLTKARSNVDKIKAEIELLKTID